MNINSNRTPDQKEIRRQEIITKHNLKNEQQIIEAIQSRKISPNKIFEKINLVQQVQEQAVVGPKEFNIIKLDQEKEAVLFKKNQKDNSSIDINKFPQS